jgi:uncharacterized protein (DUF486 family)
VGADVCFAWPAVHSAAGRLEPIHDAQLNTIQEVITLVVFTGFSML